MGRRRSAARTRVPVDDRGNARFMGRQCATCRRSLCGSGPASGRRRRSREPDKCAVGMLGGAPRRREARGRPSRFHPRGRTAAWWADPRDPGHRSDRRVVAPLPRVARQWTLDRGTAGHRGRLPPSRGAHHQAHRRRAPAQLPQQAGGASRRRARGARRACSHAGQASSSPCSACRPAGAVRAARRGGAAHERDARAGELTEFLIDEATEISGAQRVLLTLESPARATPRAFDGAEG